MKGHIKMINITFELTEGIVDKIQAQLQSVNMDQKYPVTQEATIEFIANRAYESFTNDFWDFLPRIYRVRMNSGYVVYFLKP